MRDKIVIRNTDGSLQTYRLENPTPEPTPKPTPKPKRTMVQKRNRNSIVLSRNFTLNVKNLSKREIRSKIADGIRRDKIRDIRNVIDGESMFIFIHVGIRFTILWMRASSI